MRNILLSMMLSSLSFTMAALTITMMDLMLSSSFRYEGTLIGTIVFGL